MRDFKKEDARNAHLKSGDLVEQIANRMRNDPEADWVDVIRCKDCKWFGKIGCAINIEDDSDEPKENDFCSFAERRKAKKMKDDLISRQSAIEAICKNCVFIDDCCEDDSERCEDYVILRDFPPAEPERKQGKWIEKKSIKSFRKTNVPVYECSNCYGVFCDIVTNRDLYKYCPYCGADMREKKK